MSWVLYLPTFNKTLSAAAWFSFASGCLQVPNLQVWQYSTAWVTQPKWRGLPGYNDKEKKKKKSEIFIMKSWVRKLMAFKLVGVCVTMDLQERQVSMTGWLLACNQSWRESLLGSPWFPRACPLPQQCPSRQAGRQPGRRQWDCARSFWEIIGPYISSLCHCKNNFANR